MSNRSCCRAAAIGCVALSLVLAPGLTHAAAGHALELSLGLDTYLDDNLLHYSDQQISDFETRLYPYRFGVSRIGDLVFNPSAALTWEHDRGGDRRRSVRLRGEGELHRANDVADFGLVGITWREGFARGRRLTLGYSRAPDSYVRRLYDEDLTSVPSTERYRDARAEIDAGTIAWRHAVGAGTWIEPSYRFDRRRHSADFRERDADTHKPELSFGWEGLPRAGRIQASAAYSKRIARAKDGDESPGVTPDEPDLSYHGLQAGAGAGWQLGALRDLRVLGDVSYEVEHRRFDSNRIDDPYHHGRRDLVQRVDVGLRLQTPGGSSMRAFYRFERNRAEYGANVPAGSEIGGYRVNQVGLTLQWAGELWHRRAARTAGPQSR